jgi:hypothetical protein
MLPMTVTMTVIKLLTESVTLDNRPPGVKAV